MKKTCNYKITIAVSVRHNANQWFGLTLAVIISLWASLLTIVLCVLHIPNAFTTLVSNGFIYNRAFFSSCRHNQHFSFDCKPVTRAHLPFAIKTRATTNDGLCFLSAVCVCVSLKISSASKQPKPKGIFIVNCDLINICLNLD